MHLFPDKVAFYMMYLSYLWMKSIFKDNSPDSREKLGSQTVKTKKKSWNFMITISQTLPAKDGRKVHLFEFSSGDTE